MNKMEKENKNLHSENQKFRLKNVSSKLPAAATTAANKVEVKVVSHKKKNSSTAATSNSSHTPSSDHTPDSGIRTRQGSSGPESEVNFLGFQFSPRAWISAKLSSQRGN